MYPLDTLIRQMNMNQLIENLTALQGQIADIPGWELTSRFCVKSNSMEYMLTNQDKPVYTPEPVYLEDLTADQQLFTIHQDIVRIAINQLEIPSSKQLAPVVQVHSGAMFNLLEPMLSEINIEDIAHSLSNLCRFNGHTTSFYSVAQHSVMVSYLAPANQALAALMHDASEAYLGDVTKPLKMQLPKYRKMEDNVLQTIFNVIGLPWPLTKEIKLADQLALATEVKHLLKPTQQPEYWQSIAHIQPLDYPIEPLSPSGAKQQFLTRYFELQSQKTAQVA